AREAFLASGQVEVLDEAGDRQVLERDDLDRHSGKTLHSLAERCDAQACALRDQERVTVTRVDAGATALAWTSLALIAGLITTIVVVANAAERTGTDALE